MMLGGSKLYFILVQKDRHSQKHTQQGITFWGWGGQIDQNMGIIIGGRGVQKGSKSAHAKIEQRGK